LAYYRTKNYDKAISCVDRVIDLNPNDGMAWYNKACYLSLALRNEEAIDALKKAIEIDVSYAKKAVKDKDLDNIKGDVVFKRINEIVVLEAIRLGHNTPGKMVWVTGMNRDDIEESINSLLAKGLILKKEVNLASFLTKGKEVQYELTPDIENIFTVKARADEKSVDPQNSILKELLTCVTDAKAAVERGDISSLDECIKKLVDPKYLGSILIERYPDIHRDLRFYHIKIKSDGKNYLDTRRNEILNLLSELEVYIAKRN